MLHGFLRFRDVYATRITYQLAANRVTYVKQIFSSHVGRLRFMYSLDFDLVSINKTLDLLHSLTDSRGFAVPYYSLSFLVRSPKLMAVL